METTTRRYLIDKTWGAKTTSEGSPVRLQATAREVFKGGEVSPKSTTLHFPENNSRFDKEDGAWHYEDIVPKTEILATVSKSGLNGEGMGNVQRFEVLTGGAGVRARAEQPYSHAYWDKSQPTNRP